jgi:hypothetical protein
LEITTKKVKETIKQLRRDVAEGPDGIGPRILQALSDGLPPASAVRYRAYLSENVLYWKIGN